MRKKVDVIVVNWDSGEKTLHAVQPYINYESATIICNIIVVDNASIDDSLFILKNKVNRIIANDKNLGFGKACNQALKESNADYVLLLNPDTISEPVVLEELVKYLEENREYGITGPRQVDDNKNILKTCGRFRTFKTALFELIGLSKLLPYLFTPVPIMTDWDHLESKEVDQVIGSYMVIRRSLINDIGFMDEDFFVYAEDTDLSIRFKYAGYKTFYNSDVSIFHKCGGTGNLRKANRLFYSLSSRRKYWEKHLGKSNSYVLTTISILIEPFLRMIDSLIKERNPQVITIGRAYLMYIKEIIR